MKTVVCALAVLVLTACFSQPTHEELIEAEQARKEQCDDMLAEIEENEDRPLIRATLQENYNRSCIASYPDAPG